MRMICFIVGVLFLGSALATEDTTHADVAGPGPYGNAAGRAELRKFLLGNYDRMNIPDNVAVKLGVNLLALELDSVKGTAEGNTWVQMLWNDARLKWDNETTGINTLRFGAHEVWKPDITLFNSANMKDMMSCSNTNVVVFSTGDIIWVPPCHMSAHCNITTNQDLQLATEQTCTFKLGSWTYDQYSMDVGFYQDKAYMQTEYFGSRKWKIVSNEAVRTSTVYSCCAEPYLDITYKFTVHRILSDNSCHHE